MRFIKGQVWKKEETPKKILAIRFNALGDTIVTLPYLQSVKRQYPNIQIDFLTREEVNQIPIALNVFNQVLSIGGGRSIKLQLLFLLFKMPYLWFQRYDAILDLQNNVLSRATRKLLHTRAWVEFDKYSALPAGERTRVTIQALWRWKVSAEKLSIDHRYVPWSLLTEAGYRQNHELVVLNPAGYSPSRNWPLYSYVEFALKWLSEINSKTQFVLLLLEQHREKATFIKQALGDNCIDLTGKANQVEAFAIIGKCKFMLTEDSGLMHMSWVQQIPTLALFSSSRKDWSAPQGPQSLCLDSADLECGPCSLEVCKFNDNRCLTRFTPDQLVKHAMSLLSI